MVLLIAAMIEGPWAQTQAPSTAAPILIPGPDDGYQITKTDGSQAAPSGFEGRTDTSTLTAVGNTPATMGKGVVAKFTIGNQVRTCPQADGTAEGEGEFSITVDHTDTQVSGTSKTHLEMRAKAKYKGQVGDDAYLDGPVIAEIDYSYTLSGTLRGTGGALATPAGSQVPQHITVPFVVGRGLTAPSIGAFAGGDPTRGRFSEAIAVGNALAYWAGVYYSIAQTRWRSGLCVQISFNPPSRTVQPALGTQTTVKAEVKTKRGEIVKAEFRDVHAFAGGGVSPAAGRSDVGSPLVFTYTAGNQRASNAGFQALVTSRAGIAEEAWNATLGTGWSGQISCVRSNTGDEGNNPGQSWSNFTVARITIDVQDGAGEAKGYTEVKNIAINLRPVARGGFLPDNSSSTIGTAEATRRARVVVNVRPDGQYSIQPEFLPFPPGKQRSVSCYREVCREQEMPLYIDACLSGMAGRLSEPNQLHGSMNEVKTNLGRNQKGTYTWTVMWDLARQGTSR